MSQMLGDSSPLISAFEGAVEPMVPCLDNYYRSPVSINKNTEVKMSVWQQAVFRCIARPVVSFPNKVA
jgi:hypothetical protein